MAEATQQEKDFMASVLGTTKPVEVKTETVVENNVVATEEAAQVIIDPTKVEAAAEPKKVDENPYNTAILEKFGYNTIEDLLNSDAPDKLKRYVELETEISKFRTENEELINEFSTVNSPYANEYTAKLDYMLKKYPELNVEAANRLLLSNVSSMTALDKIVMVEKIKNPELSDSEIKRSIEIMFKVDDFDDLHADDLDSKTKMDIGIYVKKAQRELEKYVVDYKPDDKFIPEKVKERINQKLESQKVNELEIERVWTPAAQHLETNFKELEVMLPNADGKYESYTKYVLSDTDRKEAASLALQLAKIHNLKEMNEQTVKTINEAIYMNTFYKNRFNILKVVADKARNDEFNRYRKERDGIKDEGKREVSDKGTGKKGLLDIINEKAPPTVFRGSQQ